LLSDMKKGLPFLGGLRVTTSRDFRRLRAYYHHERRKRSHVPSLGTVFVYPQPNSSEVAGIGGASLLIDPPRYSATARENPETLRWRGRPLCCRASCQRRQSCAKPEKCFPSETL